MKANTKGDMTIYKHHKMSAEEIKEWRKGKYE